jgi:putative tryptophan/tyrosine transport system permease protein
MSWLSPLDIGLLMGLIFSWAVLGMALSFRLFNFPDLTVEGSLLLGAVVFSTMLKTGASLTVAIPVAILAGALAGAVTGLLHVKFNINKFLAGIIVVAITYSIGLRIMGGSNIGMLQLASVFDPVGGIDRWSGLFHLGSLGLLAILMVLTVVIVLRAIVSRRGVRLRVAGSNPEYAHALGINVPVNLVVGLALTNALAAMSGILLASRQGFTDIGMGQGVLILALASMTIGERVVPEKFMPFHLFVVVAAILGSVIYQLLVSYAVTAGLNPVDLKLATSLLVLLVVIIRFTKDTEVFTDALR